jgi:hypothetical protein
VAIVVDEDLFAESLVANDEAVRPIWTQPDGSAKEPVGLNVERRDVQQAGPSLRSG